MSDAFRNLLLGKPDEYTKRVERLVQANGDLSNTIPRTAGEFRRRLEEQRDALLDILDQENICDLCGRKSVDCTRQSLTGNIDRAVNAAQKAGLFER